jgi:hypothetical protein
MSDCDTYLKTKVDFFSYYMERKGQSFNTPWVFV